MKISRFIQVVCLPLLATVALAFGQISQADDLLKGDLGFPSQSTGPSNSLIAPPVAESEDEPPEPKLTPADAANLVRQQTGGQIMSVTTKQLQSGTIYGVKILNSGRMRVVHVDGQTGELIAP
jgi:hypothetical protein